MSYLTPLTSNQRFRLGVVICIHPLWCAAVSGEEIRVCVCTCVHQCSRTNILAYNIVIIYVHNILKRFEGNNSFANNICHACNSSSHCFYSLCPQSIWKRIWFVAFKYLQWKTESLVTVQLIITVTAKKKVWVSGALLLREIINDCCCSVSAC